MYNYFARVLTDIFVSKNVIDGRKKSVYQYGFEVLISTISYTLIFVLVSLLTGTIPQSLLFFVGFYIVRKFCGGFHAKTYTMCHILFFLNHILFIGAYKATEEIHGSVIVGILIICSATLIFLFAPVDHPNKPFVNNEFAHFRKRSKIYSVILIFIGTVSLLGLLTPFINEVYCFMFGTISATISLLCAIILKTRRKQT